MKKLNRSFIALVLCTALFSCVVAYKNLKFKNPEPVTGSNHYVITKDGVKHGPDEVGELKIQKKDFVTSSGVSYPLSDVIAYKGREKTGI